MNPVYIILAIILAWGWLHTYRVDCLSRRIDTLVERLDVLAKRIDAK